MKAARNLVAKVLEVKDSTRRIKKPWWKRRIKAQINALRKGISMWQYMKEGKLKVEVINKLKRQYNLKVKGEI